jgi:hypothetical protein
VKGALTMNDMSEIVAKTDPSPADIKRQRMRSIAIAIGLGFLVIMFYAATIVHLGASVANRQI